MFTAHISTDMKREQSVQEHCRNTAELCGGYCKLFGAENIGRLSGLLHDIGKLCSDFDNYIRGISGFSRGAIDHSYFGICILIARGSKKLAHVFSRGVFGYMLFAACGVHVPCLAAVFFYKHMMLHDPDAAFDLTVKFGLYFLLPALILFLIFFFVMSGAQIAAFAKGLTP